MSEVNPFIVEDYLATARSRYTEQFKDKTVFDRYIQLLIWGSQQLQEQYKTLMQERSLDTAKGRQLDIIGDLVGLQRGSLPVEAWAGAYFGFEGDADALPFTDLVTETISGIFFDLSNQTEGNVFWDDTTYRLFIKAKIYANSGQGRYEEVLKAVKDIIQAEFVDIVELGNANIQISFNKLLTPVEKYLLTELGEGQSLFPIPIGIGVEYVEADRDFFGFEETPGALGFSSFETISDGDIGFGEAHGFAYGGVESTGSIIVEVGGGHFASLIV